MNLHYLMNELYYQRRRTLAAIVGLSIGIALLIVLNALSAAYRQAARAPLKRSGPISRSSGPATSPKELTGVVFPCSAVTIRDDQVKKISGLPGVRGIGKAVLLWVFDPNRAWIVLGIEQQNSVGPAMLRSAVTEGRFLEEGKSEALVEVSYARQFGIKVGDTISMAKQLLSGGGTGRCLPGGEDRRSQRLCAAGGGPEACGRLSPGPVRLPL